MLLHFYLRRNALLLVNSPLEDKVAAYGSLVWMCVNVCSIIRTRCG